jgi:NAD(P)-dependent dehydrogenase (short-subunit alcohol dehydrogenase family)
VIITGISPNSLGEEAARAIAAHDPSLIVLASRSQGNLDKVKEKLHAEAPGVEIRTVILDLSSQESVRKAAETINAYKEPIDVLINNAGIMGVPFSKTKEGIESQFGTNHIGHFLFTNLTLPKILASGSGARVVNVASIGHEWGGVRFEDPNYEVSKFHGLKRASNKLGHRITKLLN